MYGYHGLAGMVDLMEGNHEKAIENFNKGDETNIYFDSGWSINSLESGSPEQISIQYLSNEKELSCGYQYCWRVEARCQTLKRILFNQVKIR